MKTSSLHSLHFYINTAPPQPPFKERKNNNNKQSLWKSSNCQNLLKYYPAPNIGAEKICIITLML